MSKTEHNAEKNDVYFGKYMMWAILLLTVAGLVTAVLTDSMKNVLYTALPVLYGVSAIVYSVTSLVSDKYGVKSAVYLIALAVFSLIISAIGYLTTRETATIFYALGSAILPLLGLMIISGKYPEEIDAELGGRFHH